MRQKSWFIIQYYIWPDTVPDGENARVPQVTQYYYDYNAESVKKWVENTGSYGLAHCYYEINAIKPELVPVVQRGLTEASTEQLRDELAKRGWKVISP